MPKRSSKRPRDLNRLAASIVWDATGDSPQASATPQQDGPVKNQAAVELGRLGGLKGGVARAAKLSKKRRVEIARKAAKARWKVRKTH